MLMRLPYPPHVFASNPLDRAPAFRSDEAWLRAQREHPAGRYLPFRALHVGMDASTTADQPRLGWLEGASPALDAARDDAVLLGLLDGVPHFAWATDAIDAEPAFDGIEFRDARTVATGLAPAEAGMLAQGRSLLEWHATHRFCPQCGHPTLAVDGGARRACTDCPARLYPQVSPSMIVLVERDSRCLLARRPQSPPNRYSCLAGYVEPGESVEDAVVREVLEESGVHVRDVRYHSSQPWPFPATLMIGCFAEASSEDIHVDGTEVAEARWFSRDEVHQALAGEHTSLIVPDRIAIAHHLLRAWLDE